MWLCDAESFGMAALDEFKSLTHYHYRRTQIECFLSLKVVQLARAYLDEADNFCQILAGMAGTRNLLLAWRKGILPQSGYLSPQVEFSFHGCGCRFTSDVPPNWVDVDFPGPGRWDGFDAWRLHLYAYHHPEFAEVSDRGFLARVLDELVAEGRMRRGSDNFTRRFYFFNETESQK